MPYCRISVEKYIFSKLFDSVMQMYVEKYKEFYIKFIDK